MTGWVQCDQQLGMGGRGVGVGQGQWGDRQGVECVSDPVAGSMGQVVDWLSV